MTCRYSDWIPAYIDGELSRDERKTFFGHLDGCRECRQTLFEQKKLHESLEHMFQTTFDTAAQIELSEADIDAAWERFESRRRNAETERFLQDNELEDVPVQQVNHLNKGSWANRMKRYKTIIAGTAAVLILGSSLTIPQVKAAANDFLSIFRVQNIAMVKLTDKDIRDVQNWLSSDAAGKMSLRGLGTIQVSNHETKHFDSPEDAKQGGYQVAAVPDGYRIDTIDVQPNYQMTLNLDTEKANALLKELGSNVTFDESLNHKQFSITFPQTVTTQYTSSSSRISYTVMDAPNVNVPSGVDLDKLRSTILQLPFMPDHVRQQLVSIKDWKTTIPFPYIEHESASEQVTVNGASGIYVADRNAGNAYLMWEKDGQIHQLSYYRLSKDTIDMKKELLNIAQLYS
jgi:anti-sigma factor RsiW